MNDIYSPPQLRDLPVGRLELRSEHLRAQLETGEDRRRMAFVLAAAALVLAAALLATPALGLGDYFSHLLAAGEPAHRPPELIQRMFQNMYDARPDDATGVIPGKARIAIRLTIPGYGHKTLWVAPTRAGGYCSTLGCNRTRSKPFETQVQIGGPTSVHSAPTNGSRDHTVFIQGDTTLRKAQGIVIRFENGEVDRPPLVWVSKPIDAGFFLYLLPKSHWEPGRRPIAVVVSDGRGHELARDSRIGPWFREAQRSGLAPPANGLSRRWLLVPLGALLCAFGFVLWWRRARSAASPRR